MKRFLILFIAFLCFFAGLLPAQVYPSYQNDGNEMNKIEMLKKLREMGLSDDQIKELVALMEDQQKKDFKTSVSKTSTRDTTAGIKRFVKDSVLSPVAGLKDTSIKDTLKARIYGQSFFRNRNIKVFERASESRVPDHYILASGDIISVSVWGFSVYNEAFTIDEYGAIQPTEAGKIFLKGLRFSDAKALLIKKFGGFMDLRSSRIEVTITSPRTITVNVVGEVAQPGSYTIPAITTAFNALVAANGTTQMGSVRKILIKRGGKTIRTLDIYNFLLSPEESEDFFLEDNDYIFVPPAGKIVNITGEIRRPDNYELTEKENLQNLVKFAGGLSSYAYTKNLLVKRVINNQIVASDINLDSLIKFKKDFELSDGDSVFVRRLPDLIENYVEINGAVRVPGVYEFRNGERLGDLLKRAEGLLDEAFPGRAYVVRQKSDYTKQYLSVNFEDILNNKNSDQNLLLQKYDFIYIFSKKRFLDQDSVMVFGSVRSSGTFLYGEGLTLKDALYLAGGLTKEAANNKIAISRIMNLDKAGQATLDGKEKAGRVVIKTVEVGSDLSIDKKTEEFPLQPFDQVFVRKNPDFELQENVVLDGEVNYPGVYSLLGKEETLIELIERAGGLTAWAFPEGATLYRNQDSIGYLFLNLKEAVKNPKSKSNYILKEGDSISIPKINELVSIRGAVNYPGIDTILQINAPYEKGRRAGYYIRNYGIGFAKGAHKRKTYVTEAGGFLNRTVSFGLFKIYPKVTKGSVIKAVYKPNKEKKDKKKGDPVNWNKVIENTTVKITGILTLWLLISQLTKP